MKLSSLSRFAASFALSLAAFAGCAAPPAEGEAPVEATADELTRAGKKMAGAFAWDEARSGALVDFAQLTLEKNGTYAASVESALVDPNVVCIRFPCTLPETGTWSAFKSGKSTRILVRPSGGKPWRYYTAVHTGTSLTLTRDGETSTLFSPSTPSACVRTGCSGQICADFHVNTTCEWREEYACYQQATCERQADGQCGFTKTAALDACLAAGTPSCAVVLCAPGTQCVEGPSGSSCEPVAPPPPPPPPPPCVRTGCSGQICAEFNLFTTCEWRQEYACYQQAACERQVDGQCGFTKSPALDACLAAN